jgi:DNA primase
MVHESLRKLATLAQVPVEMISAGTTVPQLYVRKVARVGNISIDPHRILEADCLRWLLLMGEERSELPQLAMLNLSPDHFSIPAYRQIYERYISAYQEGRPRDLLSLAIDLGEEEGQQVLSEVLEKKINRERALEHFQQSLLKLLERSWMEKREEIKRRIQSGEYSEDEVLELAKEFDRLKQSPPIVNCK